MSVVSLVVTVVLLAGCSVIGGGRPHLAVAGDSITGLAQPTISAALDPTYDVDYVYRFGERIDQVVPLLQADLREHPSTVAVIENLGTNDAVQGGRNSDVQASWYQLLSVTNPVPCVVLTTVSALVDFYGRADVAEWINQQIAGLAAADPARYEVVDWNGFLRSLHGKRLATYLRSDSIHETEAGARWLAASYGSALARCGTTGRP